MSSSATSLLASQFLERLNDEGDSINERIKLADKVFNASNLPFSRKEELILIWVTTLINSENHSKEKKTIFNFLEKCLSSQRIQLDEVEIRPSVCESIFEVIQTWGFHSSCSVEVAQRCVLFITRSPIFYQCFKKNVTAFAKLISSYFNYVSQTTFTEDCSFLVQYVIDLFNETLLKRDLQEQFADKILLSIVNALVTLDEVNNSDFERKTYNSMCKIFFCNQGAASSYISGFRDLENVKGNPEIYLLVQKLLKLPKKYSSEVVEYVYPKFLQAFASSTKDENLNFEMFACLCCVIGFKPNQDCIRSAIKSVKHFEGTGVLLKMLKVVSKLNFSIDAEINDVFFSSWLISLLHSFENEEILTSDLLSVIREVILLLDPVVAEQMLAYFVKRVMLVKKSSNGLANIYCNTLSDVFNIFIKLNRIQNFLSKILVQAIDCLKDENSNHRYCELTFEDIFPKTFCKKFSDAINTQPTVSSFLILTVLQHNFQKNVFVNKLDVGGSTIVVEMIFELTAQVLQGTWVAEHYVPSAVKEKFMYILEDFSVILRSFGMILVDKQLNSRIITAYFNLCSAWGAIKLMMVHYSYDEKNLIKDQTNCSASNLGYVLNFLPDISWDILVKKTVRAGDLLAKHALFQLMEQKMSALREFEEGRDGPASLTARFILENADDDWICEHANSILPFLGPEELLSLASTLSRLKQHHKLITLLQTVEFQEKNDMVAAMGLTLLSEIARKCNNAKRSLLKKVFSELSLHTILENEADRIGSVEIKNNLKNVAVIFSNGIEEDDYETDFQISTFIQRKLELLSGLPLCYLQPQTQVAVLLVLFAAAKCLPYHVVIYDVMTAILDNRHLLDLPETIDWSSLLQWIAASSKEYPNRLILLKCLLKSAFRDSSSIGDLIHSLSANKCEPNIILCTIIATNLEKIFKKRNIDGETKLNLKQSCYKDLYSCIKTVAQMKPSLCWLPVYHMALRYHLFPKNIIIDSKAHEKFVELLPDYIKIIMNNIQETRDNDNEEDDSRNAENNSGYLELEGDFLMLVMQNRTKFELAFPDDLISTSWTALAGHLPVQKLQIFLQSASNDEFKDTLQSLTHMTTQLLEDPSLGRKVCLLWKTLLVAQLKCEKIILRNNAVDHLCNTFIQLAFQWKESKKILNIHSLLITLITSLQVKMTIQHIEMCLEVVSATPSDASPKLIIKVLDILSTMLRYRTALMIDLIPQFLQRFMFIASIVSSASHVPNIFHPVSKLADCAFSIEKLANVVMKSGKDFARVAHFAVSDLLHFFEQYTIETSVKIHLQNAVFCFLSLCDPHTIAYQMRILPPASKEIFKRIHSEFCKHHKFTGKV